MGYLSTTNRLGEVFEIALPAILKLTSPGPSFVSRKITLGVAEIALGVAKLIELGNLDARRDWSHSRDIVRGMHLMLQAEIPDDFVLSSGESHSVRDFVEEAFRIIGVNIGYDMCEELGEFAN